MTCEDWLIKLLSGQKFLNCEVIRKKAKKAGYSKGQLNKARTICGVATISDISLQENRKAKNWFWLIPKEDDTNAGKHD